MLFPGICIGNSHQTYRDSINGLNLTKQELFELIKSSNNPLTKAVLWNKIGLEYQKEAGLDSALICHKKAQKYSSTIGSNEELAISLNKIGIVHYYLGSLDSAIKYFELSLTHFDSPKLKANSLSNLGLMHKNAGNPNVAIEKYLLAYKLFEVSYSPERQIDVLNNISALHWQLNNLHKSKEYAHDAVVLAQNINSPIHIAESQNNLANVLREQDSIRKAIKIYNEVVKIGSELSDFQMLAMAKNNLAICYGILENPQDEIRYYIESIELMKAHGIDLNISGVYLNLSITFDQIDQTDTAFYYAHLALKNAIIKSKIEYFESIYEQLAKLHKQKEQFDSSLYYTNKIIALRDSINREEEELLMHQIEANYQNVNLKNDLLKSRDEIKKSSSYLRLTTIVLAIIITLLLATILILRRYKQRNQNLSSEVSHSSQKISGLKAQIIAKNDTIQNLQSTKEGVKKPYPNNLSQLTQREKEVFHALAQGLKDQEIANELYLSITTIRSHLRKLYVKIDVRNRAEAVQFFNNYQIDKD